VNQVELKKEKGKIFRDIIYIFMIFLLNLTFETDLRGMEVQAVLELIRKISGAFRGKEGVVDEYDSFVNYVFAEHGYWGECVKCL
jgi:hypothetical protein